MLYLTTIPRRDPGPSYAGVGPESSGGVWTRSKPYGFEGPSRAVWSVWVGSLQFTCHKSQGTNISQPLMVHHPILRACRGHALSPAAFCFVQVLASSLQTCLSSTSTRRRKKGVDPRRTWTFGDLVEVFLGPARSFVGFVRLSSRSNRCKVSSTQPGCYFVQPWIWQEMRSSMETLGVRTEAVAWQLGPVALGP